MNIVFIIAIALAVVGAGAVIYTGMRRPCCPACRSYEVSEREDGYICHECGSKFLEY